MSLTLRSPDATAISTNTGGEGGGCFIYAGRISTGKSKDQDGDPDNHSVTVTVSELTFGDDEMSQALNLDESTTVDPGITWRCIRI